MLQSVLLHGITKEDIERLFEEAIAPYAQKGRVQIIYADCTYLYQFDASDNLDYLAKTCNKIKSGEVWVLEKGRYVKRNPLAIEWHRNCERWFQDQTVRDNFGRIFKPMAILRSLDKVPNEGLEVLSGCFVGEAGTSFKWHGLGKGIGLTQAYASDQILVDEIERIDVTSAPGGGSLSRDGSTIYAVGNHEIDMPGAGENVTETALFDDQDPTLDKMGDHSIFPDGIPHNQGNDAMGSTTVIYPCSV